MCWEWCFEVWFVYLPKSVCSMLVGLVLGLPPAVAFTASITAITVVRLPINVYFTFKVALTSLILKPGLR